MAKAQRNLLVDILTEKADYSVEDSKQFLDDLVRLERLVRVGQGLAEAIQHMLDCNDEECLPSGHSLEDYVRDALVRWQVAVEGSEE